MYLSLLVPEIVAISIDSGMGSGSLRSVMFLVVSAHHCERYVRNIRAHVLKLIFPVISKIPPYFF
jgi:hypothetical protein